MKKDFNVPLLKWTQFPSLQVLCYTVPIKSKLTLNSRSSRESRIELRIETRFSIVASRILIPARVINPERSLFIINWKGVVSSNLLSTCTLDNRLLQESTTRFPIACSRFSIRAGIALMHVYVTQANFTTKPRFEIKNKRSFTEMNSQGSRVEKNTHAQKVQMQKILFTNEACWWNLLVWRNHA